MQYWDNAATTFPKPMAVKNAIDTAILKYGANPGRGGHTMAYATSEAVYRCREEAASLFGVDDPSRVIFTLNCTMSLNMVIKGVLKNGGRALISDMEHNAVLRPLFAISNPRPVYDIATVSLTDSQQTVENFKRKIRPDTKLIVCTHASNVWGTVLPIREIGALAHSKGIPFAVDAAQTAGVIPIDMEKDNVDFLCVAGHKGLYGPMGTGMLITSGKYPLPSFIEGGTGSRSLEPMQPVDLPDHLESGTPNTVGICGLCAGIQWVKAQGCPRIWNEEIYRLQRVYRTLNKCKGIRLYTQYPQIGKTAPVLSFNVGDIPSEVVAQELNKYGVAVRAGLHCAPMAHRKMGTEKTGAVRLAPSVFTSANDAEKVCKILVQTTENLLH